MKRRIMRSLSRLIGGYIIGGSMRVDRVSLTGRWLSMSNLFVVAAP